MALISTLPNTEPPIPERPRVKSTKPTFLGPNDPIGSSTCPSRIHHTVLPPVQATTSFHHLRNTLPWQKMYHRTGEVPRLVHCQGTLGPNGIYPIYRHPADSYPEIYPFTPSVNELKDICEGLVGHELNHVLIQLYRNGADNISEHSDKTLDIMPGTFIVNLSLGTTRVMVLRTKRASAGAVAANAHGSATEQNGQSQASTGLGAASGRVTQRVPLPHGSALLLSMDTNADWLHSIRADGRPDCEKSAEELGEEFNGERISLTFRHIGTFVDPVRDVIWGIGAKGKMEDDARPVLRSSDDAGPRAGDGNMDANRERDAMIIGFGMENHMGKEEWIRSGGYAGGFDVV